LKPALEPIIVFQKPYEGKPFECICETGAGALWIDGGRIGTDGGETHKGGFQDIMVGGKVANGGVETELSLKGRWPANLIHDGSDEVVGLFPQSKSGNGQSSTYEKSGGHWGQGQQIRNADYGDSGSAARFFYQVDYQLEQADPFRYQSKAARKERDAGLEGREAQQKRTRNSYGDQSEYQCPDGAHRVGNKGTSMARNSHPTVKPLKLTQYLATLLLPPAEYAPRRILVPFCGSGSEAIGAGLAGWEHITGIELGAENVEIAEARLAHWLSELPLFANVT